MTGSAFHAVAPVSRFVRLSRHSRTHTHRKPQNRTLRRCAGALRERQAQKETACRRLAAEGEAAIGEAGEKTWRFSAPERPLLPAVRAVLGGKNGAFLRG